MGFESGKKTASRLRSGGTFHQSVFWTLVLGFECGEKQRPDYALEEYSSRAYSGRSFWGARKGIPKRVPILASIQNVFWTLCLGFPKRDPILASIQNVFWTLCLGFESGEKQRPDYALEEYSSRAYSGRSFWGVRKGTPKRVPILASIQSKTWEPV